MTQERDMQIAELLAALKSLMSMEVKGHQLQDRLQFSTPSRQLLGQCLAAIANAEQKGGNQ